MVQLQSSMNILKYRGPWWLDFFKTNTARPSFRMSSRQIRCRELSLSSLLLKPWCPEKCIGGLWDDHWPSQLNVSETKWWHLRPPKLILWILTIFLVGARSFFASRSEQGVKQSWHQCRKHPKKISFGNETAPCPLVQETSCIKMNPNIRRSDFESGRKIQRLNLRFMIPQPKSPLNFKRRTKTFDTHDSPSRSSTCRRAAQRRLQPPTSSGKFPLWSELSPNPLRPKSTVKPPHKALGAQKPCFFGRLDLGWNHWRLCFTMDTCAALHGDFSH